MQSLLFLNNKSRFLSLLIPLRVNFIHKYKNLMHFRLKFQDKPLTQLNDNELINYIISLLCLWFFYFSGTREWIMLLNIFSFFNSYVKSTKIKPTVKNKSGIVNVLKNRAFENFNMLMLSRPNFINNCLYLAMFYVISKRNYWCSIRGDLKRIIRITGAHCTRANRCGKSWSNFY